MTAIRDQRCHTCVWWDEGGARLAGAARNPNPRLGWGTCMIATPTCVGSRWGFVLDVFPETHASRRCSNWERDEPEGADGDEPEGADGDEPDDDGPGGGEEMPRLVGGRCAPCRDGRKWQ